MEKTQQLVMDSFRPGADTPYRTMTDTDNLDYAADFREFALAVGKYLSRWGTDATVEFHTGRGHRHVYRLEPKLSVRKAEETRVALAGLLDSSLGSDVQDVLKDAIDRLAELERA